MSEHRTAIQASQNYCGMKEEVAQLIHQLRSVLYPEIFGQQHSLCLSDQQRQQQAQQSLEFILAYFISDASDYSLIASQLIEQLPMIKAQLDTDVMAAYEGDPAAQSYDEIMLAYPSFEVLSIYRIAHHLYQLEVPILPRMMTEYAHRQTGIDIHPGATIGDYFFIDHGTGVVIGETAVIGHHVKIYQGVTIGAKSFEVDQTGEIIKGIKRHPNIGNHVVIYANATILGGDTTIGDEVIVGSSVWITKSVPARTQVITPTHEVQHRQMD